MESKLVVKNLRIGYVSKKETTIVFEGISANFEAGMMIGIIGRNGLGKSTLLRTISGLQEQLGGDVLIDGMYLDQISRTDLAKKIAVVLTEKVGGFNLTVTDLVSMGRVPFTNAFNQLNSNDKKVVEDCISLCGLAEHSSKPLNELSDGLFQKAMIAKGFAQQTPLILLDEPTAFLDFPSKHQLFELLKSSCNNNKCVIVSSHDIELVLKYCTHLLIMSENNEFEFITANNHNKSMLFEKVTNGYFT